VQRDRFESILDAQIKRVQDVLVAKATEYANEDVLANFKKAAHLRGVGLPQAVLGMMTKHTVSVFDMVESGKPFDLAVWDEKITDHINYLILIRAALVENTEHPELNGLGPDDIPSGG
jgi:hypothetical protein